MATRLLPLVPGLALTAGLAALAHGLDAIPALHGLHLGPLTLAIVLGMALGNLAPGAWLARLGPGLHLAQSRLLRLGVVLYGFRLSFAAIAGVGLSGLALDAAMVVSTLALGSLLGRRLLGLDRDSALLVAAGSAICGAAAVLATEPVLKSPPHKAAAAVGTVVLFGTLAMLLYPHLYPLAGLPAGQFGTYLGATVHEVAQVVAAGKAIGEPVAASAVVSKMCRVLLLAPFLAWLSWRRRGESAGQAGPGRITIPWFALGFLAAVALNSLLPAGGAWRGVVETLDSVLLATAMAGLGLGTTLAKLRQAGTRPLLLAGLLFLWLVLGGYGLRLALNLF